VFAFHNIGWTDSALVRRMGNETPLRPDNGIGITLLGGGPIPTRRLFSQVDERNYGK